MVHKSPAGAIGLAIAVLLLAHGRTGRADDCQLTPVIHILQYPGCIPKPIPSFACMGKCTSYVQVSGVERDLLIIPGVRRMSGA